MDIYLNGTSHKLGDAHSVAALVAQLKLTDKAIAVAVNRHVVARHRWEEFQLNANDHVDVVRAIGGG